MRCTWRNSKPRTRQLNQSVSFVGVNNGLDATMAKIFRLFVDPFFSISIIYVFKFTYFVDHALGLLLLQYKILCFLSITFFFDSVRSLLFVELCRTLSIVSFKTIKKRGPFLRNVSTDDISASPSRRTTSWFEFCKKKPLHILMVQKMTLELANMIIITSTCRKHASQTN